jgi:plastocyanin
MLRFKIGLVTILSCMVLVVGLFSSSGVASAHSTQAVHSQTVTVQIVGTNTFSFSPASITITPGTTVKWINHTQAAHTVTGGSFGSTMINPGGTYTFTFHAGGRFAYHCSIHPYMTGTVIVK